MVTVKKIEHNQINIKSYNIKARVNGKTAALINRYCEEHHTTRSALIREALFYFLQMKGEAKDIILAVDKIVQD